jgi:copper chaperone CopZ
MERTIRFRAEMSCEGCSNAITRILNKVPGVSNVQCDIPTQAVMLTAEAAVDSQLLLSKLQVWGEAAGKQVELIS